MYFFKVCPFLISFKTEYSSMSQGILSEHCLKGFTHFSHFSYSQLHAELCPSSPYLLPLQFAFVSLHSQAVVQSACQGCKFTELLQLQLDYFFVQAKISIFLTSLHGCLVRFRPNMIKQSPNILLNSPHHFPSR